MKKSLITYSIIIFLLLAVSFFTMKSYLRADRYSFYGNVWYLMEDSCAPSGLYLYFKVIYEDSSPPCTTTDYFCPNNCFYGYNSPYGNGQYTVIAWHINGEEEKVTEGAAHFRWDGSEERHDIKVYGWDPGGD
jgi:hypothetical protein